MSDSEGTGERSPKDQQPASKDGQPPPSDESRGDQPSPSPASPTGGGSPKTASSSSLTTPQSISLPGELSPASGDTSSSKSGDKTREASPTSQGSISPRSPESKRPRRSSVSFVKTPTVHPIPPRSRSAPVSPPGCLAAVESAVELIGAKMKKFVKGKVPTPPVNSWMKEVPTRRYRCACGRLYNWGETPSTSSEAGPKKAVPEGKCDKCDNTGPLAPLADPEDLTESELEEPVQQPQVSIVVHPPTDEPMLEEPSAEEPQPEEAPSEMPMLEEPQPEVTSSEVPMLDEPQREEPPSEMPEGPPEPPCDEAA